MANEYEVNYDDKRFSEVEADKQAAMGEVQNTYGGMINSSDQYYNKQIEAAQDWANKQTQLQNEQTDFAIEKIEQDKAQAQKDYTKEQSGAYVDWKKQSNQYGANAEQMAANGMTNTGYSESSQVSMYNTYQNRVATARESYNQAVLNYNNSIKEARLQNNATLAEIAYQSLQTQLQLSLEGFQYKNNLLTEQMNMKMQVDDRYYSRYQDVLSQINQENQFAYQQDRDAVADQQWQTAFDEDVRQFNKTFDEQIRQFEKEYKLQEKEYEEGIRQFNEEIKRLKAKDAKEYEVEIKQLELQRDELKEKKRQFNQEYKLAKKKYEGSLKGSSGGGGGSGGSGGKINKPSGSSSKKSTVKNRINPNVSGVKSGQGTNHSLLLDNKSVLQLGQGPVSGKNLANQVNSGKVTASTKGNKITVKYANPTKDLLFSTKRFK